MCSLGVTNFEKEGMEYVKKNNGTYGVWVEFESNVC